MRLDNITRQWLRAQVDAAVRARAPKLPGAVGCGTDTGYVRGCRCPECTEAARQARAGRRALQRAHTTVSANQT